jgi:hypothetical protein
MFGSTPIFPLDCGKAISCHTNPRIIFLQPREVIQINKKTGKVIVKGINFKFKHLKPNTENEIGEIKQFEGPIHHSNVKLNLKEVS